MKIKQQFRSIIQWENPEEWQLFYRFSDKGDEIKNASKLIIQAGQGCLFTYEGKIQAIFEEEGLYNIKTDNRPFITSLKKVLNLFESEHKVGLWFYRKAAITNIRWGTRIPITYNDPFYGFPVNLRAFGNYSLTITQPEHFFRNIIAGQNDYYCGDLQELFLSRISQPIANYLANARFSYADIDAHIEEIAQNTQEKTTDIFGDLGFRLIDFRIEGTSFDEETKQQIAKVTDVQADVKAAQIAGVDFSELQKLKALRDTAKNEGAAGASMGMMAGLEMGKNTAPAPSAQENIKIKLKELKELYNDELITEEEYNQKRKELLDKL